MEDKTQKEKIREKWAVEIAGALARAYTHEVNEKKVLDPDLIQSGVSEVMEQFDLAIKETEERLVEKLEHIPNPFHSINMDRIGMEKAGEFESNRSYILSNIRNK